MENPAFQRAIRSFVLRQGHLSPGQQRAMDEGMPRWGIEYRPERIDLEQAFGRAAPKILEIGFGMGGATAEIAAANPAQDYLGVEVHSPGVGNLCKLIAEKELSNLRIIRHDAVEVLDHMLADGSLDGVHIFFPDPWHKKRHNKRRLIQAPLVEKLVAKLKPGGYLHAATDWEDYALQIMEVFSGQPQLVNTADGYAPRPDYRPLTKFEARGIKLGHGVWDVIFRRR
ncbi:MULTISPECIES: tRNA (guanosine(46)-N7)-methyltransferase TrmB [Chromobacterium]|uniref:tRNA (guanosine(46)-N7)-methyltransferase TrmB n=1 Tax=Chromobacterium TaxID=535 RepID=UPI000D31568C|nr:MULTISPECIES: tRNA (guanosine(46)-N7)-methyltransferase TrmB [Chromobacterium]PTU66543.1 tRNA (guanosine(46)-N7)-methyltransferase TrmB [Chromobacterium sp. Panama]UJB33679.1 tRNA (guanosine(46)-N7)-methyltransferase TrmB [Chromobacterium sp. Beijing]